MKLAAWWWRLLVLWTLAAAVPALHAQDDEIQSAFKKLDAQEERRLRALLAAPVPTGLSAAALDRLIREREAAAALVGDDATVDAVLSEAIRLLPPHSHDLKKKVADRLISRGRLDEGISLMREVVAAADPANAAIAAAELVCAHYRGYRNDDARQASLDASRRIELAWAQARANWQLNLLARARGRNAHCLSLLDGRYGRHDRAIELAEQAEQHARLAHTAYLAGISPMQVLNSGRNVASSIVRRIDALRAAGRLGLAERAIAECLEFVGRVDLPPQNLATIYRAVGDLRFAQREFAESEKLMRKSVAASARSGNRDTSATLGLVRSLAGQRKWSDASAELDRLDAHAGGDAAENRRRHAEERALVHFGNRRFDQAAPLYAQLARYYGRLHGSSHFLVAQAEGMHGAAQWLTRDPGRRELALPLLKSAVGKLMLDANADYLENIGLRKELREAIFDAYLDAVSTTSGEDPTEALGAADWLRAGVVQDAINDAAVRAAAGTPELADLVRREQDAKHEAAGLRRFLGGEPVPVAQRLPQVAQQMRARIAALEDERARLRAAIAQRFADFARLTRPALPGAAEIARELEPQQALMVILPAAQATYVWALARDRAPAFARAPLGADQVAARVARLRRHLDFGDEPRAGRGYDAEAAFELFDRLLAPLRAVWQGKAELVVVAGGALGQLPLAVLHTQAHDGPLPAAPWLVRELATTQIPSVGAWLSIKAMSRRASAGRPFLGWGDPTFDPRRHTVAGEAAVARQVNLMRSATLQARGDAVAVAEGALQYAQMPPLPETRAELLAIARALDADPASDVVLGDGATRDSVLDASRSGQLSARRVVAFATHGLRPGDLPSLQQPALAMAARAESSDPLAPLLTLQDVLSLKLNADWVVLSACNTAAGDGSAEESLSGLARGFFYAGARRLLVTHWAVETTSATLLTTETFRHYAARPERAKAEHLRQAMLELMGMPRYAHPAYWAPYVLVGDGGS